MDKVVDFKDITNNYIRHGKPNYIFINKEDNDLLETLLPDFYDKAVLNKSWATGKLGVLHGVPVLPGVVSEKQAKLCWGVAQLVER